MRGCRRTVCYAAMKTSKRALTSIIRKKDAQDVGARGPVSRAAPEVTAPTRDLHGACCPPNNTKLSLSTVTRAITRAAQ